MPCLIASIAFFFPRFAILLLVIAGDYFGRAYDTLLWPLLGFFFAPYTALAYAFTINHHGSVEGFYIALIVLGALMDVGAIGGGSAAKHKVRAHRVRVEKVRSTIR